MRQNAPQNKHQSDRFKDAARELGCDEDEARFEANLKKVAQAKPMDKQPGPKVKKPNG